MRRPPSQAEHLPFDAPHQPDLTPEPPHAAPAAPTPKAGGGRAPRPRANLDTIVAYTDGGARGNPGPAGYGVRIESPDGTLIKEFHAAIGIATNNVAEYGGLLAALRYALEHAHRRVVVRSDSELMVKQMRGLFKVKHPGLQELHREARALVARLDRVTFEHVRRAQNAHADRLANDAMDAFGKEEG